MLKQQLKTTYISSQNVSVKVLQGLIKAYLIDLITNYKDRWGGTESLHMIKLKVKISQIFKVCL